MKICSKCNIEQPVENFSIKNKQRDTRNAWCKECNKQYNRQHYINNNSVYKKKAKEYERKNRQYIFDYLRQHPCEQCGEARVAALQFDHINRLEKSFNIAEGKKTGINKLKLEISKCRVLCANCHAVYTAEQLGWYKDLEK